MLTTVERLEIERAAAILKSAKVSTILRTRTYRGGAQSSGTVCVGAEYAPRAFKPVCKPATDTKTGKSGRVAYSVSAIDELSGVRFQARHLS